MRCKDIRGFNYDGSWGTSGLDLWQHHDHGTMAVEIARGKAYFPGWNVSRWWLSQQAFQRNPGRFLANLDGGLSVFARHGILVMPVLFNRWRNPVCDFGGVALEHIVPGLGYRGADTDLFAYPDTAPPRSLDVIERLHQAYLEAVVGAHAKDERIFAWDLCNEPLMAPYVDDPGSAVRAGEVRWLTYCYRVCKRLGARQPLTIGNYSGKMTVLELTQPISDIIPIHPYFIWNAPDADRSRFEAHLNECAAFARLAGKELLATETVWGAVDDDKHIDVMRYTLTELQRRDIGFIVHALQHSLVADLHYPAYGPVDTPECLHFVNPDGSLRKGHEAFNEFS